MNPIFEKIFDGYGNYPVIIGVFVFCLYAIIAPPLIKNFFNKLK